MDFHFVILRLGFFIRSLLVVHICHVFSLKNVTIMKFAKVIKMFYGKFFLILTTFLGFALNVMGREFI